MFEFFLDTANLQDLKNITPKIKKIPSLFTFKGITTNPNILYKTAMGIKNFGEHLNLLQDYLSSTFPDKSLEIHIEIPTTILPPMAFVSFCKDLAPFSTNALTSIVIKIPPHPYLLRLTKGALPSQFRFNVTGITHPITVLRSFSYPGVKYVSFLMGRLESAGIPLFIIKEMVEYVRGADLNDQYIIMGSIRNKEHIQLSFEWNCIPTLKPELMSCLNKLKNIEFNYSEPQMDKSVSKIYKYCDCMETVSENFFNEMDEFSLRSNLW